MLYIDEIMGAIESLDIENALDLFDKYRPEYGDEPEYISAQAILCIKTHELESARDILLNGLEKHPDNTDLLYNLGYVYQALGAFSQAREFYTRSIKSTDNAELIDELTHLCIELDVTELTIKSGLELISFIYNEDYDANDIVSELLDLPPLTDTQGLILVKAKDADIFALRRDPSLLKRFAGFRVSVPKRGYLKIDTSALSVSTISPDELRVMDFSFDPDAITYDIFRLLLRRLAFEVETTESKKALSNAFLSGQLGTEEIASIIHATVIDKSRQNEIIELIQK